MAGKNTPNSSTRLQRKLPHTKYSSRQLIYTKATRIFLQHQILILYTALFQKGQSGFSIGENLMTERAWSAFSRGRFFFCLCWLYLHALVGNRNTREWRAWRCSAGNNGFFFSTSLSVGFCNAALLLMNSLMCLCLIGSFLQPGPGWASNFNPFIVFIEIWSCCAFQGSTCEKCEIKYSLEIQERCNDGPKWDNSI